MKRVSILVSATAMATSALVVGQACSSDDADRDVEYLMGTGGTTPVGAAGSVVTPAAGAGDGSSSGGTSAAPGGAAGTESVAPLAPPAAGGNANAGAGAAGAAAGGMAAGGTMSSAGAAGAPGGMGGSTGIPVPPPGAACPAGTSPTDGGMCVVTCTDDCGVFGIGARLCSCNAGEFDCASCGYDGVVDPLIEPPTGPLPPCASIDDDQEDDNSGCEENERCQSIGRADPEASFENRFCACRDGAWDCDTKPANFP